MALCCYCGAKEAGRPVRGGLVFCSHDCAVAYTCLAPSPPEVEAALASERVRDAALGELPPKSPLRLARRRPEDSHG